MINPTDRYKSEIEFESPVFLYLNIVGIQMKVTVAISHKMPAL